MARAKSGRFKLSPVFQFQPNRTLERRYVLGPFIGYGYEGEVYHLTERSTKIERVVKFFYADRYPDPKRSVRIAQKLHRLRDCSVVLQYHHHGGITWRGQQINYVVSDLVQGHVLSDLLQRQPRKRFTPFEALHIIYSIAKGVAEIHARREYHGDIHDDNILLQRRGIGFRIKLIDLYVNPERTGPRTRGDVGDIACLLYGLVGGPKGYPQSPRIVKEIVCGRRRDRICAKFRNAGALADFLMMYDWPEDQ